MTTEQTTLRDHLVFRLNRRPFQPFIVQLVNGERHVIARIAQMAVGLTTAIIADAAGTHSRHLKIAEISAAKDI
jgi:hypothetical protein